MKAAVLHNKRDIKYEDIPMPELKEDEVLIAVKACGICGSDVPRYMADEARFFPIVLGHEFSGLIEQKGEKVPDHIKIGGRASVAPLIPCHECENCQKGNHSLCKHYKFIGSRVNGAMADYVAVPYRNIVQFSDTVSFKEGAFFEPSTIALHGVKCADYKPGKTVAILGAGTIGIFTIQWAKILGARKLVVFDIDDNRLNIAKELGANEVYNTLEEDFMEKALASTNGYDYVFETAGNGITMNYAFKLAANKSSVCFIGTAHKDVQFPWRDFELMNRKEFHLTGSWMGYSAPFPGDEWTMTSEYFNNGKLVINDNFIDTIYPMKDAETAFERFSNPREVSGKILLVNE